MKFSVLLPTRNRLEYLRYAIETVRRQDFDDWEVVVSDNCSEDDIAGYVRTLADSRVRYVRTSQPVPVTDNWNNALQHSAGDYVVMLGDDDGLLPGYFSTLVEIFKTHPDPEFVYTSAYFFAYRGAVVAEPEGFLRQDRNRVFTRDEPFWLDAATGRKIARDYLDFRMPVASNMQFSLISRCMIDALTRDGPFFRSPFPDFYATPLLFLRSERTLICPQPLVVVGITPKSYGAFHFSDRPAEGTAMLANEQAVKGAAALASTMLPGTAYNDSWLLAMEALRGTCAGAAEVVPNHRRYRFLQIVHMYKARYLDKRIGSTEMQALKRRMTLSEKLLYASSLPLFFTLLRSISGRPRAWIIGMLRRLLGQHDARKESQPREQFGNLLDVYEHMKPHRSAT